MTAEDSLKGVLLGRDNGDSTGRDEQGREENTRSLLEVLLWEAMDREKEFEWNSEEDCWVWIYNKRERDIMLQEWVEHG